MKKRISFWTGLILIVLTAACVDKISFDVGDAGITSVVIDGYITNEPGPYEVEISRTFNLETQATVREGVSVQSVEISDNVGNIEKLIERETGIYSTEPDGIRGVVGRVYKLRVEFFDGRIYETVPDTMKSTGSVTQIDHNLVKYTNDNGKPEFGFDIFFDSEAEENRDFQFLWKLVMTYQISTTPSEHLVSCISPGCPNPLECFCPDPLPCSGNFFNDSTGFLQSEFPCECCECWLEMYNELPVLSDEQLVQNGLFRNIKAGRLPITDRTLQYKTHVEVQQYSLSLSAYNFWKAIKAQKEATSSLFQPLSGRISGNIVQVEGAPTAVEGIFYASSVSKNSIYISADDVPNKVEMIPTVQEAYLGDCRDFKGATTRKPIFWQ